MDETEKEGSEAPPSTEGGFTDQFLAYSEDSPFTMFEEGSTEDEDAIDDEDIYPKEGSRVNPSVSSGGEAKKEEEVPESEQSDPDVDLLSEQEKKCIKSLKDIKEVTPELIVEISSVFQQYQRILSRKILNKVKSEEKIWWKLEDTEFVTLEAKEEGDKKKVQDKDAPSDDTKCKDELDELQTENEKLIDEREVLLKRIADLEKDVDKICVGDEAEMKEKTVASYVKETAKLRRELDSFEDKLIQSQADNKVLEAKLHKKEEELAEMEERVKSYKDNVLKIESKKKTIEADIEKNNSLMDQLKISFNRQHNSFMKSIEKLSIKDDENEELMKAVKGFYNQQNCLSKYIIELRDRLEHLSKAFMQTEEQNQTLKNLCVNQTDTLKTIKRKSVGLDKLQESWSKKLEVFNIKFRAANERSKSTREELHLKLKEIKQYENEKIAQEKLIRKLQREKDEAMEKMISLNSLANEKGRQVTTNLKTIESMKFEIINLNKTVEKQQADLDKLNKQNNAKQLMVYKATDENELMTNALQTTVQHLLDSEAEVQKKEREIRDLISDYNNVLNEKKALRARLLQINGEAKNNEHRIRYLKSIVNYDKEKLDHCDDTIKKLTYRSQKLQFDYNTLKIVFKERKLEMRKLIEELNSKEAEKGGLDCLITRGENIRIAIIKDAERLRHDVSTLKTVIQRRNAEISLAYEKTELMTSILNAGERELGRRMLDIHRLKTEVSKLRAENKMLIKAVENNTNLKKEINCMQKDLAQAKQKCRALEEQMENPINVHRWRILKGKDPEKSELIEMNQTLKTRLLQTQKMNTRLKEELQAMEITYTNLKEKVTKSPEDQEYEKKFQEAQRVIWKKNSEIKRLTVTLESYQLNTRELQREMEKIKLKADDSIKKYYDLKRIHDLKNMNKTDDELMSNLPFEKTCLTESRKELIQRVLHRPPDNTEKTKTGIASPKSNKKVF